jgi:hypothetical protein
MKRILPLVAALFITAAVADAPPPDAAYLAGDFAAAERAYSDTLAKTPDDPTALIGLARIRLYQERRAESRRLAEHALALDPANDKAKRILGALAMRDAAFAPGVYRIDIPKDGATIPFLATDPLPLVKVRVQGHDAVFVIDTGGPDLVLDKDFAAELGIAATMSGPGTFAGGMQAMVAHAVLGEFAVGPVTVRNIPVGVLPTRNFALRPGTRIDGVIGTGFLMHFLSTIDYEHGALVLQPRDASASFERSAESAHANIVPMWLVGDHFVFARAHIDNAPDGLFSIDTGLAGGGIQATKPALDEAGIKPDESEAQTGMGGGGPVRVLPFTADATLGTLTEKNVAGAFTPDGDQFRIFPFAIKGTLSHGFFRAHALSFDFVAMKLVIH